jgi:hypothetical protein
MRTTGSRIGSSPTPETTTPDSETAPDEYEYEAWVIDQQNPDYHG